MQKRVITLFIGALGGAAFAQSSVSISGSVASAYERSTLADAKASLTGFDASANNITFKGTEDLGGGLKAGFELNQRFNSATGSAYAGRSFENSFVTLSGGFGNVKLGRHQAISVAAFDVFSGLGVPFENPNGPSSDRDYTYNNRAASRYDSAISYGTPKLGGFSATLVTTVNPTVNTDRENTALGLAYANGPLSVLYVHEVVGTKTGDVRRSDKNLGASYDFGVAKGMLLWGQEGSSKARATFGVTVPVGGNVVLKAAYRTKGESVNASGVKSSKVAGWALGSEYSLSKRTSLFADYGDYKDSPQAAFRLGMKHTF